MIQIKIKNQLEVSGYDESLSDFIKVSLTFDNPHLEQEARRLKNSLNYLRNERQRDAIINSKVADIDPEIRDFEEKDGVLILPRGYLPKLRNTLIMFGVKSTEQDCLPSFDALEVSSKIQLRDYQDPFVTSLLEKGGGLGIAPPGAGKTVMALELIARAKLKTLWITHTSALAKQSMERAEEFLGTEVGFIGSGKWKPKGLTIALVQTLARRDLSEIVKDFGLVIVDECHHCPSRTFSEVVKQFWAKYLVGISATPYRKDKLETLMFNAIGPVNAKVEKATLIRKKQLVAASVIQRQTGVKIPESVSNFQKIMKIVDGNQSRINMIVGDTVAEASLGNVCVVLVSTISYGRKIKDEIKSLGLQAELVFNAEVTKVGGKMVRKASMSKKDREQVIDSFKAGDIPVLVATFDFLAEGFDHKPLNRLFLASPISHRNHTLIEQSCGRVERTCEGKTNALIYDYVDEGCPMLNYMAEQRIPVYEQNLMEVVVT